MKSTKRFLIVMIATLVSCTASSRHKSKYVAAFEHFQQEYNSKSVQLNQQQFVDVWTQQFEFGRIFYLANINKALVLENRINAIHSYATPDVLITYGKHNMSINQSEVKNLLQQIKSPEQAEIYRSLIDKHYLVGGIGTLYIQHDLHSKLGLPLRDNNDSVLPLESFVKKANIAKDSSSYHYLMLSLPHDPPSIINIYKYRSNQYSKTVISL